MPTLTLNSIIIDLAKVKSEALFNIYIFPKKT